MSFALFIDAVPSGGMQQSKDDGGAVNPFKSSCLKVMAEVKKDTDRSARLKERVCNSDDGHSLIGFFIPCRAKERYLRLDFYHGLKQQSGQNLAKIFKSQRHGKLFAQTILFVVLGMILDHAPLIQKKKWKATLLKVNTMVISITITARQIMLEKNRYRTMGTNNILISYGCSSRSTVWDRLAFIFEILLLTLQLQF